MMNDFTNVGQLLNDMEIERDEAIERAEALAAEVERLTAENAALRSQLDAATTFRPVSEAPPDGTRGDVIIDAVYSERSEYGRGWWLQTGGSHRVWLGECEWRPAPPQE